MLQTKHVTCFMTFQYELSKDVKRKCLMYEKSSLENGLAFCSFVCNSVMSGPGVKQSNFLENSPDMSENLDGIFV